MAKIVNASVLVATVGSEYSNGRILIVGANPTPLTPTSENIKIMEIPKCRDCGQQMLEVCTTGQQIEIGGYVDGVYTARGIRTQKLYQCPEDKTIAVD